jgi:hypothetical protein
MRALNANFGQSKHGVFTKRPETLINDFFANLLEHEHAMAAVRWLRRACTRGVTGRRTRSSGPGTRVDLVFGSNSQLRAVAEVYACADSKEKFVKDFVAAWTRFRSRSKRAIPSRAARTADSAALQAAPLGNDTPRLSRSSLTSVICRCAARVRPRNPATGWIR